MRAWLNNIGGSGAPWTYQGEIASGVGVPGDQVRFADVNGDGRDDYLVVGDQGQVRAWLNTVEADRPWTYQGEIAASTGAARSQVNLADVDGNGRDDYLVVYGAGAVTAWLNDRFGRADPWDYQGRIASSSATREQVRFADLTGDGRDDYLVVGTDGQVTAWWNVLDGDHVGWDYQGRIATGAGPRDRVRFADVDGDGRDDYLVLGDQGQVDAWRYTGSGWAHQGVIASGVGASPDQVRFADVNGDGRDDYLVVDAQGRVRSWLNDRGARGAPWKSEGQIADGVGAAGSTVTFADVNGDRRDDYLVMGEYGQIRAWINNRGGQGGAWLSLGEIASGVGAPRSQVDLAEINGDRRADYLVIDDGGGVRAWYNNQAAPGSAGAALGTTTPMRNDPSPPPPAGDNGAAAATGIPICVADRCS
ncbi:hypothetical protein GCM10009530_22680 [Microbispora corallina]|uniref:VCBS repeat-containing protein n=1 Tax=Microbispora corallina TaxID=83302 RepID=A0ABQ4G6E7_9ACTN|nr:hypothetical protein Mco01_56100 [Microbispora corallina]